LRLGQRRRHDNQGRDATANKSAHGYSPFFHIHKGTHCYFEYKAGAEIVNSLTASCLDGHHALADGGFLFLLSRFGDRCGFFLSGLGPFFFLFFGGFSPLLGLLLLFQKTKHLR